MSYEALSFDIWQPIEMAPINGSPILVGFMGQFSWVSFIANANGAATATQGYAKPSHWVAIPAPPAVKMRQG